MPKNGKVFWVGPVEMLRVALPPGLGVVVVSVVLQLVLQLAPELALKLVLVLVLAAMDGVLTTDILPQCADLTLSDSFEIPSDVSCKNATDNVVATPTSTGVSTPSATSPADATTSTSGSSPTDNAALRNVAFGTSGVAGLLAAVLAIL